MVRGWRSSALSETEASGKRHSVGAGPTLSLRRFAPRRDLFEAGAALAARLLGALRSQVLADRRRWTLWLPVALGTGIGLYFALPFEPAWPWAVVAAGLALIAGAASTGVGAAGRVCLALIAAASLGFAAAKVRTELVHAPVLPRQIGPVGIDARVVEAEPRGNGSRMILQPVRIGRLKPEQTPALVRVSVRARSAVPVPGSWLHVTAVLMPPPGPTMPGDYDFGRWAFYQRIGAVGYLYGRPKPIAPLRADHWYEGMSAALERLRGRMTARIREVLPNSNGAIAAALITGERSDVDPDDEVAYRYSGLTHVLSISGLHLALAGGFFFWTIRALFALFPVIVLRFPVKKWAAVGALAGATFYLLISGCEAPAVRSYIMLAMMFLAILFDRPALSMRAVALAATIIMLFAPESLTAPGCQMSFACVIGLIALAEWAQARRAKISGEERKTLLARLWRYGVGIVAVSTVAGLASAPIAIFYFDRAAQYGLVSNLAAEPVVGVVIMPAATAAMVLMPFGLDRWPLIVMGWGVDAMTAIAYWAAALPGAASVVAVWPLWCLIAVMGGGLWIAIWRQNWRWIGLAPIAVGIAFAFAATPPDILVARDVRTVAVRVADGKLALVRRVTDNFAAANWLRRSGDKRTPDEAIGTSAQGVRCDAFGCIAKARDGTLVAVPARIDALAEDCANVRIVISAVPARRNCIGPQLVIDKFDVAQTGGYAIWLGEKLRIETVEGERGKRPWSSIVTTRNRIKPRASEALSPGWPAFAGHDTKVLVSPYQSHELALHAHAVGAVEPCFVGGVGRFQRDGVPPPAQTLQRRFVVVDQRHDDLTRVGGIDFLDDDRVAVENARVDHGIAGNFERVMVASADDAAGHRHVSHLVLQRLDRRARRDAPDERHIDGTFAIAGGPARRAADPGVAGNTRVAARVPDGAHALRLAAGGGGADRIGDIVGQLDDFKRAGALFHAPEEAAFLQRRDQPVDAGFGLQVEGILHLVERRRNAAFAHPFVDEHQQFVLFAGEHCHASVVPPCAIRAGEQIRNMENRSTLVLPGRQHAKSCVAAPKRGHV